MPASASERSAGYRFVLPLVCATALATWLLREPLVKLLFTREFLPLTDALTGVPGVSMTFLSTVTLRSARFGERLMA